MCFCEQKHLETWIIQKNVILGEIVESALHLDLCRVALTRLKSAFITFITLHYIRLHCTSMEYRKRQPTLSLIATSLKLSWLKRNIAFHTSPVLILFPWHPSYSGDYHHHRHHHHHHHHHFYKLHKRNNQFSAKPSLIMCLNIRDTHSYETF